MTEFVKYVVTSVYSRNMLRRLKSYCLGMVVLTMSEIIFGRILYERVKGETLIKSLVRKVKRHLQYLT